MLDPTVWTSFACFPLFDGHTGNRYNVVRFIHCKISIIVAFLRSGVMGALRENDTEFYRRFQAGQSHMCNLS